MKDLLFDDSSWRMRYLVVRTPGWFCRRSVSLSTNQVGAPSLGGAVSTRLRREELRALPSLDVDPPVARQQELRWACRGDPRPLSRGTRPGAPDEPTCDPHLRSTREVTGYQVLGQHGILGRVIDALVDDGWRVRYLSVALEGATPHARALLPTIHVRALDWARRTVEVKEWRGAKHPGPEPSKRWLGTSYGASGA